MKNNYKKSFTLTEAIVSFLIIGLIFIATITNIGMAEHYDKLYWQAFNTLYQASKEAQSQFDHSNFNYEEQWTDTDRNDVYNKNSNIKRKYPSFLREASADTTKDFCLRLTEHINTTKLPTECKTGDIVPNIQVLKDGGRLGVEFYKGFCNSAENVDCNGINPSFTALNGQKFYIMPLVTANFVEDSGNFTIEERESFRFVVVDLNGNAKPNSQFRHGSRNPDLVLFAIKSDGDVIPLGLPEFSKAYINAMVYYPNILNSDGTPVYSKVHSGVETLWNAKKRAWGKEQNSCTASDGAYWLQNISDYEALSQSTKFYYNARTCIVGKMDSEDGSDSTSSKQVFAEDCAADTLTTKDNYVDELYTYLVNQFIYKEEGSGELYNELNEAESCDEHSSLDIANGCNSATNKGVIPLCSIDFKH